MAGDSKAMPIAVIGFGCRFPGDVTSGEKLWDMLLGKQSARSEAPPDRYNVDAFYHPDGDRYGTTNNRGGHFLTEDISLFDAPFFSISPAEAMAMDPMQRILLEVTYEALENSGTPIEAVSKSKTSCFVGCFTKDYEEMLRRDMELAPKYQSTGASQTMLSNRLSYFFDLKGPSVTLDTACSSGLVAVHLACQSLRAGESSMAVVGGSNLILSPDIQIEMSDMHFLSPDSKSYSFDDRANGYARGEGVGVVILKPLDLALRDSDPIRAVIRGTAASSDGRTPGITMPSKEAQIDLIRSAYQEAGCDVSETGYFEAHGTGTAAGDPIETGAIGEVFGPRRPLAVNGEPIPLPIGSVKTNIGHLEGASGIAGLIKAVLSVESGTIAPNIWFKNGNPNIDFKGWRLQVPTEAKEWPAEGLRRASVNSFGYGGTNAHVIIDDAYHYLQRYHPNKGLTRPRNDSGFVSPISDVSSGDNKRSRVFALSANDENGLARMGKMLGEHLQSQSVLNEEELLDNLAYTLTQRRSQFSYNAVVSAKDTTELSENLKSITPVTRARTAPQLSFVFTGQGAQWWGMGRELLQLPLFKGKLELCDTILRRLDCDWSLMEELLKDGETSRVNEATFSQPLCTALQIALVDLLASWGIRPTQVVGHSSGEIGAAYATGALTIDSAMTIAYFRGHLSPKVKALGYQGSMMAVGLSEEDTKAAINELNCMDGSVTIACVNSPCSITVSGDTPAVKQLHQLLEGRGIFARILLVDTAYHSHHMEAIAQEYLQKLQEAKIETVSKASKAYMFSSVTEQIVQSKDLGPEYWVKNLVSSVRFSGALTQLCTSKQVDGSSAVDMLLEVGPHSLLKLPVREILQGAFGEKSHIKYLSTLIRNKAADTTAQEAAGHLFATGYPVDLHSVNFPVEPKKSLAVLTNLPRYSWNHTRSYWYESRLSRDYRLRKFTRTEIVGAPVYDWNPIEPRFRNFLRLKEQPWLWDHMVQGDVLFPACGYICMAVEACRQLCEIEPSTFLPNGSGGVAAYRLREVSISRALVVPESDEGVETSFSMRSQSEPTSSGEMWYDFRVYSYSNDGGWVENCRGSISISDSSTADEQLSTECAQDWSATHDIGEAIAPKDFYAKVDSIGLAYGPLFQGITDVALDHRSGQVAGTVEVIDTKSANPKGFEHDRLLHPATLDSFLQLGLSALGGPQLGNLKSAMVPTHVGEITIASDIAAQIGDKLNVFASAKRKGAREAEANIFALDPITSKAVVLMDGFKFMSINNGSGGSTTTPAKRHCYQAVWEPDVELMDLPELNQELQAAPKPDERPKTVRELEFLSFYFIDLALQKVHEDEIPKMHPHHQRFYRDLCRLRNDVRERIHPQQTEEWRIMDHPEVLTKLKNMTEHYRNHPTAYDGKLLVRVGEALPEIFTQEIEQPLELMTRDNLLEDYYTTAVGMPNTYAQISRFMTILSHKNPNLEFLEIGAGTGGATVPTLNGLRGTQTNPRLKSYTYTDISSYFFQRAAEKFNDFADFMKFKKLDVEHDPETQDFKAGSYDVIVAANVLHATSDMHRTMTHVRKLLRPGGKLVLLEMTNRLLAASVIFGTLPGWWNASEEWRTGGPLLTEDQWETVLRATGFSSLQASSPDVLDPLEEGTRLMIATAVETNPVLCNGVPTPPESPDILIIGADSPVKMTNIMVQLKLKARLESAGWNARITTLSRLEHKDIEGSLCISFVELSEHLLATPSESQLKALQSIAESSAGLIWVTRGADSGNAVHPELAVFQGLARTIRAEYEGLACITLGLDAETCLPDDEVANLLIRLHARWLGPKSRSALTDSEYMEKNGVLHIKRTFEDGDNNRFVLSRTNIDGLAPRLEVLNKGNSSLQLKTAKSSITGPFVFEHNPNAPSDLGPDEVEISVQATHLGPHDLKAINGDVQGASVGQECTGFITKVGNSMSTHYVGDRVATWCKGGLATHVRSPAEFVHRLPEDMRLERAATLPLAFATAYYALNSVAHITRGDTVLIHEAADAIGQAAVQIVLDAGAEIFVTVRSDEEKELLSDLYKIDRGRILFTNPSNLIAALRRATQGRGIDIVLNTLSGEALQATFSCMAPFGRFIELNNNNAQKNERLEMSPFQKHVSFSSVDMEYMRQVHPKLAAKVFQEAMDYVLQDGLHQSSPVQVRPWSKLDEAVEIVQDEKNLGQVVLVPKTGDEVLVAPKAPQNLVLRGDASYLLAGGLGGLGRSISRWLVAHGAKYLIFISRSGATSSDASAFVADLKAQGINVAVLQCNISDALSLHTALTDTLNNFPPIRGVLQGAMTLNDSLFANMTHAQWTSTLAPKVLGSKNLHEATLSQPLDFFILLSSLHSFIGNPGQANYAAGCAYQVALAKYRNGLGLPGAVIDLGIVGDVGYVVDTVAKQGKVKVQDFKHISEKEMLALIELAIKEPMLGHLVTGLDSNVDAKDIEANPPFFAHDPVLSHLDYLRPYLKREDEAQTDGAEGNATALSLTAQLSAATSQEEVIEAIQGALLKKLSRSLMMEVSELDVSRSMNAYGTDSLVAVEMKNWIQREAKVSVSVFEILQASSFRALVERIADKSARSEA